MKKGDVINGLQIIDIASNGRAVGRHEDLVVFVDRLVPGDVADVKIFRKKKRFLEAWTERLVNPSPDRIEPVCEHFGVCGGCKWQHFNYDKQLEYKHKHVSENLRKIGGFKELEVRPVVGADPVYAYRNKMEYTFSNNRWLTAEEINNSGDNLERNALGFHIPGRFDKIIDVNKCHLQDAISDRIRNFVRQYALENQLTFFDLRAQQGLLRNLIVRNTTLNEVMVILVVTEMNEAVEALLKAIQESIPEITSLHYMVNTKRNDSIQDLEAVSVSGDDYITEKMDHLKYRIGPKSFYQTNSKQAEVLYGHVNKIAALKSDEVVYDLYTGAGTIANYIASQCKKVIGLEYVTEAVDDAKQNSELNNIQNADFLAGDIKNLLTDDLFETHGKPDVIITDPPRAGMHPDVVSRLNESGASRIVYVSCNSATQARDLALLTNYSVSFIQPVDMFPQTAHVESIAHLVIKEVPTEETSGKG